MYLHKLNAFMKLLICVVYYIAAIFINLTVTILKIVQYILYLDTFLLEILYISKIKQLNLYWFLF